MLPASDETPKILRPGPILTIAGLRVELVRLGDEEYATLPGLCESLGLDAEEQREAMPDAVWDRTVGVPASNDDEATIDLIPCDRIGEWLLSLDPGAARPGIGVRLAAFQEVMRPLLTGREVAPELAELAA